MEESNGLHKPAVDIDKCPCNHPMCQQSQPLTGNGTKHPCISRTDTQKSLRIGFSQKILCKVQRHKKRIILGCIGLLLVIIALVVYLEDPLEQVIAWQTSVIEGTIIYEMWRKPPLSVLLNLYLFNVTNPVEFLEGREKLRVQEVGPYVYREVLENSNVTFNENGTVTFRPLRELVLERELSVGDPAEDTLTFFNIPYLGAVSMLSSASVFTNLGLRTITSYLESQPFISLTAEEILLGYEDPLVKVAHTVLPSFLGFSHFGLLDRMYAEPEGGEIVSMKAGYNKGLSPDPDDWIDDVFSLDTYNGSPGMEQWGYGQTMVYDPDTNSTVPEENPCHTIRGAFEGIMFPRKMSDNKKFYVYRRAFCRTFGVVYDHEGIGPGGYKALWYQLDPSSLNPEDFQNLCYCDPSTESCLPSGFSDASPCYFNIPLAVSKPHFLAGEPSMLDTIDGLSPSVEEHESYLVVQPELGIPLTIRCKIQMNLVMKKAKMHPAVDPFNDLILPVLWIDFMVKDLPPNIQLLMTLALYVGPVAQAVFIGLSALVGSILILLALFRKERKKDFFSCIVNQPPEIGTLEHKTNDSG